ncbi:MAG: 4Fe-4S cluster-binding domain-containing protein [Anaerohalosphaeraceae bacterium]
MKGIIFDIKEFALNDGPGIRTTVFMKGCPLRCQWCHNPEGLQPAPQRMVSAGGSRIVGQEYDAVSLAAILKKNKDVFCQTDGGVTFSGGEPLMQAEFIVEVMEHLDSIHILLDTSGYAARADFIRVASCVQHVFYDLKLMNPAEHLQWTGKENGPILQNLLLLDELKTPYTIRVPLIPSITATRENLEQMAAFVKQLKNPREINLLPYNVLAGGKYESVGMKYKLDIASSSAQQENLLSFFSTTEVPVRILGASSKQ